MCFAVNRSLANILSMDERSDSIRCINGIRVLSMSWVVLSHTMLFPVEDMMYGKFEYFFLLGGLVVFG